MATSTMASFAQALGLNLGGAPKSGGISEMIRLLSQINTNISRGPGASSGTSPISGVSAPGRMPSMQAAMMGPAVASAKMTTTKLGPAVASAKMAPPVKFPGATIYHPAPPGVGGIPTGIPGLSVGIGGGIARVMGISGLKQMALGAGAMAWGLSPSVGETLERKKLQFQVGMLSPEMPTTRRDVLVGSNPRNDRQWEITNAVKQQLGGNFSSTGSDLRSAGIIMSSGFTAGQMTRTNMIGTVGYMYGNHGVSNETAASAVAGLYTGKTANNLYRQGIMVSDFNSSDPKSVEKLVNQIYARANFKNYKSMDDVNNSIRAGATAQMLAMLPEDSRELVAQALRDKFAMEQGGGKSKGGGRGAGSWGMTGAKGEATRKALGTDNKKANPFVTEGELNRSRTGKIDSTMDSVVTGINRTNEILTEINDRFASLATGKTGGLFQALGFSKGAGVNFFGSGEGVAVGLGASGIVGGALSMLGGGMLKWGAGKLLGILTGGLGMNVAGIGGAGAGGVGGNGAGGIGGNGAGGTDAGNDTLKRMGIAGLGLRAAKAAGSRIWDWATGGSRGVGGNGGGGGAGGGEGSKSLGDRIRSALGMDGDSEDSSSSESSSGYTPAAKGTGSSRRSDSGSGSGSGSGDSGSGEQSDESAQLGDDKLIKLLYDAGFRGKNLRTAYAVAMAESGGNARAHNPDSSTGDNSYGLFQINMLGDMGPDRRKKYNLKSNDDLFDPATNIRVAWDMSNHGKSWGPWTTYTGGKYKTHLDKADEVAAKQGYAKGSWRVSKDQTANIHEGEMILPASIAANVREAVQRQRGGYESGARQVVINVNAGRSTFAEAQRLAEMVKGILQEDASMEALVRS